MAFGCSTRADISEPDRAVLLEEAASLLAMSQDFVYRHWKRLGAYKDADHHIKFRMSDIQRHLQRKAGPPLRHLLDRCCRMSYPRIYEGC